MNVRTPWTPIDVNDVFMLINKKKCHHHFIDFTSFLYYHGHRLSINIVIEDIFLIKKIISFNNTRAVLLLDLTILIYTS